MLEVEAVLLFQAAADLVDLEAEAQVVVLTQVELMHKLTQVVVAEETLTDLVDLLKTAD
jgi:hypothetical protein